MKFYEALRLAQEEGKKIRQANWQPNEFIYWEDSSNRLVFIYDRLFSAMAAGGCCLATFKTSDCNGVCGGVY